MKYDCLFIGNAIVDILTDVSFEYMHDQGCLLYTSDAADES